jgi:3-oxoacyl-[acyl-carrier protein] reductase
MMHNDMPLGNKVVLVTGSSRGIGAAIALASAGAGADVAVTYRRDARSAGLVAERIRRLGRRAECLEVDVSSEADVQRMAKRVVESFGRIDVLVNNAGILQQKPFPDITVEDWDRMMAVNLKGCFLCSREVLPVMEKQARGSVVNIASSGGQLGGTLAVHYAAGKAGVISLTKSLARIGAAHGIRVNCVSPGLIDTEMTGEELRSAAWGQKREALLIKRAGTPDEVAEMVVFLSSEAASYITGQTMNVNGGLYLG